MNSRKNRRTFIKECAALTALAASATARGASEGGDMAFICITCGTQYPESAKPPRSCPICEDERQYVGMNGQEWTTLEAMRQKHKNVIKQEEPGLYSINPEPKVGIGQRAFLLQTSKGNILWDCVALLDPPTIRRIKELGGIADIAVSHPHYYTTMIEWSRAFGDAPIHIHTLDRKWVMRPDPCVRFWEGESKELRNGLRLVCTGGHFEGFQVLHWPMGANGRGVLMAGDQPQVCMDPHQVSFMYSYPNFIPLNATAIHRIVACLKPLKYDRLYGAFFLRGRGLVDPKAKAVVERSAERYLRAIQG
jgi:hypothetical protein